MYLISYRIFLAAFFTLLIILNKIKDETTSIKPNNIIKWLLSVLYILATFYWILSIFGMSKSWYVYLISGFVSFCVFIYYFFVYLYNKKEYIEPELNFDTLIGKIGSINSVYEDGYIGKLLDTNELVFIHSLEKLKTDNKFIITDIKDGKINAIKYEK